MQYCRGEVKGHKVGGQDEMKASAAIDNYIRPPYRKKLPPNADQNYYMESDVRPVIPDNYFIMLATLSSTT